MKILKYPAPCRQAGRQRATPCGGAVPNQIQGFSQCTQQLSDSFFLSKSTWNKIVDVVYLNQEEQNKVITQVYFLLLKFPVVYF